MADPVYLHWAGLWILTPDGLGPVLESSQRVVLRDVRFVIDPVGLAISRNTGKRKTHAWAFGERVEIEEGEPWNPERLVWFELTYRPRRGDDHFGLRTERSFWSLKGAGFLDADLKPDGWTPFARVLLPVYGETERRQVQHYGGRR